MLKTYNLKTTHSLANGVLMPAFGLGVWASKPGDETRQAVAWALELGYRHIDTAEGYLNEEDVGRAIGESAISRKEIFVTTKLNKKSMGSYDVVRKAFDASLKKLNTGNVDLYLIHWPSPDTRKECWKALEAIYRDGQVRAIGVSNYTRKHLEEVMDYASIRPMVNQVEFSPYLYQKELLEACREWGIVLEAYSPLTRGMKLNEPNLVRVAEKQIRTPAQVLIRWALQHDTVAIPKSVKRERLIENLGALEFSLDEEDMAVLDSLNENFRCNPDWNPDKEK